MECDNLNKSGRFETSTKTKIKTKYGTILKVTTYDGDPDSYPDIEYKIRPICDSCGKPIECFCFNSDNSVFPYEDALSNLQRCWLCGNDDCLIKYKKEDNPELYNHLQANYNGDKKAIADAIADGLSTLDEGEYCNL